MNPSKNDFGELADIEVKFEEAAKAAEDIPIVKFGQALELARVRHAAQTPAFNSRSVSVTMPALEKLGRITLPEGLNILQRNGLALEDAQSRLRLALIQKAFSQEPVFALPYDKAAINWETGSVKIQQRKEEFFPTLSKIDFEAYFFDAFAASQIAGSAVTDAEIRGGLLKRFYELRHNNGGQVPTSDMILTGSDFVGRQVIGNICEQLAAAGLIQWEPLIGLNEGDIIGVAKITGHGVDVVSRSREANIDIRFPAENVSTASYLSASDDAPMSDVALKDIREVVSTVRVELPALSLSNSAKAEITADIRQIEIETDRPTARRKFLKTFLECLRDNLAKVTANGLVTLLVGLIAKYFHVF